MIKPFLLIQSRPEDDAAYDEYKSIMQIGYLAKSDLISHRIEQKSLRQLPDLGNFSGIIIGGGPSNISDAYNQKSIEQQKYEPLLYELVNNVVARDFPFLGICYGMGLLASHFKESIVSKKVSEPVGGVNIKLTNHGKTDPLLKNVPNEFSGFAGHKEGVEVLPEHVNILAYSSECRVQMIKVKNNVYATQFHPELNHDGLAKRIDIYKNHGYFEPQESEKLKSKSKQFVVEHPYLILENFIKNYSVIS